MADADPVAKKILAVQEEMQKNGWWSANPPDWVNSFDRRHTGTTADFTEWLQFIYLPNRQVATNDRGEVFRKSYIAPQVAKFIRTDPRAEKLLQLLIELDSL